MITLHGFPFSNYHNIVKHALMAKGLELRVVRGFRDYSRNDRVVVLGC